jgi:hypothetical protein
MKINIKLFLGYFLLITNLFAAEKTITDQQVLNNAFNKIFIESGLKEIDFLEFIKFLNEDFQDNKAFKCKLELSKQNNTLKKVIMHIYDDIKVFENKEKENFKKIFNSLMIVCRHFKINTRTNLELDFSKLKEEDNIFTLFDIKDEFIK